MIFPVARMVVRAHKGKVDTWFNKMFINVMNYSICDSFISGVNTPTPEDEVTMRILTHTQQKSYNK